MAFQIPISIKEAINNIHSKKYLLPAIQREVVWDAYQVERLFDSLMRDYTGSYATAINDSGVMAGYYEDSAGVYHGFIDNGGTFTTINGPGAGASDISYMYAANMGQRVGMSGLAA